MKQDPQQLSNQDLIEVSKIVLQKHPSKIITELITRFERLSLGNKADEAIREVIKPQEQPQQHDEVEALAEKIWIHMEAISIKEAFEISEKFINYRNERRGKNGK